MLSSALKKHRGQKRRYAILEDNDPTVFKSKVAIAKKVGLNIQPLEFPTYSPDLNPLDFSLWAEVDRRMANQKAPEGEANDAFKARLKHVAMSMPESVIKRMLASVAGYERDGGHIRQD